MEPKESFCQLCKCVQLEDDLREKAWNVWESVAPQIGEAMKGGLIPWFICTIYITYCNERLQIGGYEPDLDYRALSVSNLLKASKMRLVEFFHKMKELIDMCDISSHVVESLTELKKTFCVSAALFYKLNRGGYAIKKPSFDVKQRGVQADTTIYFVLCDETRDSVCKHIWLLFTVCKGYQMPKVTDLMTAFYLLLCCIDHIHRRFLVLREQTPEFAGMSISLDQGILPDLCQASNVPYSKIYMVYTQYFQPFLDSFSEDQMHDTFNVDNLTNMYEDIWSKNGNIDERDFFEKHGYLWTQFNDLESNSLNVGETSSCTVTAPATVTTASTTTATEAETRVSYPPIIELRTALDQASDAPSQELLRFLSGCQRDPQNMIQTKLSVVQELFVKNFTEAAGEENTCISFEIFTQAKKLYFRVMEAMLLAEEKRLSCSDFSALLNSEAFHESLLACSLEVIIAENRLPWLALEFPWILSVVNLKPFDFFKVIESFILHEPHLGSNLIKHLNRAEEQILESLAWTTQSPLFAALDAGQPSSDYNANFLGPSNRHKKSQPLNLFLRKVNQMAYLRLTSLCNELDIDEVLRSHMWTCLEQSLRLHWQLMKDRHLDQMLLCAIYAISKVTGREIQFKQIVASYKTLPFASARVYRGTPVAGKESDSIIGFYNRVYMVTMKPIILQFAPSKNPPVSPAPKSSLRILGKKNVYLSPLRSSPGDSLTPKSRSLYSFGDSPGSGDRESLSRINASMRAAIDSQPRPPQKRLRFEECDNIGNGSTPM